VTSVSANPDLGAVFAEQRGHVWGLCYRMTGSRDDADDLLQETFVRVMHSPPRDTERAWRPWLIKVATNLAIDALRRRRRRPYVGPWLPSPLDSDGEEAPPAYELPPESGSPTEGRYELMESVSYAFLVALEALTPRQRAVLLLRDVFDYSVEETAEVLALSAANVKTTLHRARRAMHDYDRRRCRPDRELRARTRAALESFLLALASQDAAAVERLLSDDVLAISDGGAEFSAAKAPVRGRDRVSRLFLGLLRKGGGAPTFALGEVNGLPAVKINFGLSLPRAAPRGVFRVDIDADGRIYAVHVVMSTDRLSGVTFPQ